MNFVHSFWSKPLFEKKFMDFQQSVIVNIVNYAQSVEYIHKFGHTITLYADELGAEILAPIPYDNVVIVENKITDNYHLAASIKIEALKRMSLTDIHIDGDLYLQTWFIYDLFNTCADVTFTFNEHKDIHTQDFTSLFREMRLYKFEGIYKTPQYKQCAGWVNTSTMQFNNQSLKDEFIEQYEYHASLLKDYNGKNWPDIVIEQYHLTKLCEKHNADINYLNPYKEVDNQYAVDAGVCHQGGPSKVIRHNSDVVTLESMNYPLCVQLQNHVKALFEKYG